MKYMLTFSWEPKNRAEGISRFQQQSGSQPPRGIKLLGRWTRQDLSGGWVLLEVAEPKALTEFAYHWSDIMALNLAPVMEDAELGEVFRRVAG